MIKFPRTKLSFLVSLGIGGALPQAVAANGQAVEEIVVMASPIRDSQKSAIDAKRAADNTVDIVSADTIGRFPDQNLADSLGRLPGLAIERDQGQARYINFRGAPFRYTALAIDGISVPGAENGRIARFDSFPSVITSRIEANKAILPSMPGESVSGFINIATFDPFDVQGWSVSTDLGLGAQQLGDGDIEKRALRASWSGDNAGFSLFASHNRREQITDNREYDLEIEDGDLLVNELDFRSYKLRREDKAYGGRFEYRPWGVVERLFVSSLYTEFQDREERNQYVFDFAGGAAAVGTPRALGAVGAQPLVLVTRMLQDGLYQNSTWSNTLGADFALDEWRLEARLNHTQTENSTFLPIPYSAGGTAAARFDLSKIDDPILRLSAPFSDTAIDVNQLDYAAHLALMVESELDIDAVKIKLDAERDLTLLERNARLKTGLEYDRREAEGFGFSMNMAGFPGSVDIADFATGKGWHSGFSNSIGGSYYDNVGLRRAWQKAAGSLGAPAPHDQLIKLEEKLLAGYAMLTTEFDWGNLVLGGRVENTDYRSEGPEADHGDDFTHFLPGAHLNFDLREDLKLRLSASTGVSRPTYSEWRAAAMVDVTSKSVVGGNPGLRAEEAWGSDASLEWYLGEASLLSAGAFLRNIDRVIYADSSTIDGGIYMPGAEGEQWSFTGFVNGSEGRLRGLELNLIAQAVDILPGSLDGLGLSLNATLLDSEFETLGGNRFSLPGTSDTIYNASLFFERERFSVRLNYQYRDDWLSTTENDSMAEYWAAQKRLDLSASYELPQSLFGADVSLYLNGNNLGDAVDVRYVGDSRTPNQIERYGRSYTAGFRVNF